MWRKIFVVVIGLLFVLPAFALAGEGSDTIGANKLLPQLRYSYNQYEYTTDFVLLNWADYEVVKNAIYAQVNWGVTDYIELYALVGAEIADLHGDWSESITGDDYSLDFSSNLGGCFLWGLGAKATFYRSDNGFYIGGGVAFTHSFSNDDRKFKFKFYEDGSLEEEGTISGLKVSEINFVPDLHVGWNIKSIGLTPYFGIEYRWTWAKAEIDLGDAIGIGIGNVSADFEQKQPFGVYAGFDYFLNDKLYFNVQGNMINRWGVNAGFGYLFDL